MKRLYSLLLALGLLFLLSLTAAGADRGGVTITVDGQILDTEEAYINDRGVTMIPLRAAATSLHLRANATGYRCWTTGILRRFPRKA